MMSVRGQEAALPNTSSNTELEELEPSISCQARLKVSTRDMHIDAQLESSPNAELIKIFSMAREFIQMTSGQNCRVWLVKEAA